MVLCGMRIAPAPPRAPATASATGAWGVGDVERPLVGPGAAQRCRCSHGAAVSRWVSSYFYLNNHPSSVYVLCEDRRFDDLCGGASAQDDVRGSRVLRKGARRVWISVDPGVAQRAKKRARSQSRVGAVKCDLPSPLPRLVPHPPPSRPRHGAVMSACNLACMSPSGSHA